MRIPRGSHLMMVAELVSYQEEAESRMIVAAEVPGHITGLKVLLARNTRLPGPCPCSKPNCNQRARIVFGRGFHFAGIIIPVALVEKEDPT